MKVYSWKMNNLDFATKNFYFFYRLLEVFWNMEKGFLNV